MQKTGCLITADGSTDQIINPEGLLDYEVPKPMSYLPPAVVPATFNDAIISDKKALMEEEMMGDVKDFLFNHELVGRNVKA